MADTTWLDEAPDADASWLDEAPAAIAQRIRANQPPPDHGLLNAIGLGSAQGATAMLGDEAGAAIQAALPNPGASWNPLASPNVYTEPPNRPQHTFGERYEGQVAGNRADNAAAEQHHPWGYGTAQVAASLPAAIATGGGATAGARIAGAAGMGAVNGFGAGEGAAGSAIGTGAGAILGAGGQALLGETLFPYLQRKMADRARNLLLQKAGITRKMISDIAKREGGAEGLEAGLDDMERTILSGRVKAAPGANLAEKANNARDLAGRQVRGFYRQADAAGAPGLSATEIVDAPAAATGGKPLSRMGQRAEAKVWDEAEGLLDHQAAGTLGLEDTHNLLLDIGERAWPKGAPTPPEGVDPRMFQRFTMFLKDRLRERALAGQPAGASITPEDFQSAIGDYTTLLDVNKAAMRGSVREASQPGLRSAWNHAAPWLMGTLGASGAAASHADPLLAAGVGAGAAGLSWLAKSPAVNRLASKAVQPAITGALGRATEPKVEQALLPKIQLILGQGLSADLFAKGKTSSQYTPPSPNREP